MGHTSEKELYDRASARGTVLSDRDRGLVAALEPFYRLNPPDRPEVVRRLVRLIERYPNDAELWLLRAFLDQDVAAFDRTIELDDSLSDALAIRLQLCGYLGRFDCAREMDQACRERAPGATLCLAVRAQWKEHSGECEEVEKMARSLVANDPTGEYGPRLLALALASTGKPKAAIEQALEQRWALSGERRDLRMAHERGLLAALFGDFDDVARKAQKLNEVAATSTEQLWHGRVAYLAAEAEREEGRLAHAAVVAMDFLNRRDGWSPENRGDDFALAWDVTPAMLRIAYEGGAAPRAALDRHRDAWAAGWAPRMATSKFASSFIWLHAWAGTTFDQASANAALAKRASFEPIVPFRPEAIAELYEGVTYLLAGRIDEAIERLRFATRSCRALRHPFEHVRAHDWLGRALEAKGLGHEACDAYAAVISRWGEAKPRSVTAQHARERLRALGCQAQ
jgi:serine/threonine-protein kinase